MDSSRVTWRFIFLPEAHKQFNRLDKAVKTQIQKKIDQIISREEYLNRFLSRLTGNMSHLHSLHVGNYRLICEIKNEECLILAVEVAHRRHVYGGH